jgi:hypothetical protein
MADSLNQVVLNAFRQANGNAGAGTDIQALIQDLLPQSGANFSAALTDASKQIDSLRATNQALAEAIANNTVAVTQNSASQGGRNAASTAASVASTVFGSGLGLIPLISSIAGLFGAGKSEAPAPLLKYIAPAPLQLDFADTGRDSSGFAPIVYGQNGLPKSTPGTTPVSSPQISIQVNALDSRSFLDHSTEIAAAVREAMLNSHALNDVVSDL